MSQNAKAWDGLPFTSDILNVSRHTEAIELEVPARVPGSPGPLFDYVVADLDAVFTLQYKGERFVITNTDVYFLTLLWDGDEPGFEGEDKMFYSPGGSRLSFSPEDPKLCQVWILGNGVVNRDLWLTKL